MPPRFWGSRERVGSRVLLASQGEEHSLMSSKLMPSSLQPLGILKLAWRRATVLGSRKAATEPAAAFAKLDSSDAPSSQDHPELKNNQEICELRGVCKQASPPSHACLEARTWHPLQSGLPLVPAASPDRSETRPLGTGRRWTVPGVPPRMGTA